MKLIQSIFLAILLTANLRADAAAGTDGVFIPQNQAGQWTFSTNQDATVTATENALSRRGLEVFQRVFLLKVVAGESANQGQTATAAEIRRFIKNYRPPAIPYTSEATARRTGREKFNCLEFAEDIAAQANSNGIPAEVIGIMFKGRLVGHACAGFPTAEGPMLFFDSTPSSGHISHGAQEAWVKLGSPYRRADGGELAGGVENLPVSQIIPVTKLTDIAVGLLDDAGGSRPATQTRLVVLAERRVQANGIEYAGPDTLIISTNQLAKWNEAAEEFLAARASQQEAQKKATLARANALAAKALSENEALAAQNDPYGQLRMGERYLSGDGVKKNPAQARAYLQQAADQGSLTAKEELKLLDNPGL